MSVHHSFNVKLVQELTLKIYHFDFIVLHQCKLLSLQHYILWFYFLLMICISELASYLIEITFALHRCMKMVKALGILTTLAKKVNLKHIILSEPVLSLFNLFFLYPCISLNFLYVFLFSPGQGLVEHILMISHVIMVQMM